MTGGSGDDEGIMPRLEEIFRRIKNNEDPELTFRVKSQCVRSTWRRFMTYSTPRWQSRACVREHPKMGGTCDLSTKLVTSYEDIENWMEVGIKNRTRQQQK